MIQCGCFKNVSLAQEHLFSRRYGECSGYAPGILESNSETRTIPLQNMSSILCQGCHYDGVCGLSYCSVLQPGPSKTSLEERSALPQGDVPIVEVLAKVAEGEIQ